MLFASSCRKTSGEASSEYDTVVFDTIMSDSIVDESKDTVERKKVIYKDTDSILKAIEESPDRSRYEAGILPQMARDVPEYAGKLLANEHEGFLIVDKNTMKLYRYDRFGVEQERVGIAVSKNIGAKHKRRDNRTPEGFFSIEGIYDSTEWLYTDDDGNTSPVKGQFGPRYMRLRTPVSSQIGIHGTVAPWSIGGRRSHGCIRMTNENILRFAEICKAGWPVIVSPGPRDMRVNEEEGYDIPSVAVIPGRPRCKPGKAISNPIPDENKTEETTAEKESAGVDSVATQHKHELHIEEEPVPQDETPKVPEAESSDPDLPDPLFN